MSLPVTLVVPTYNRHRYLTRLLDYYEQAPFKIIIADSSAEKYTETIKHPDCRYLHYPGESITQKISLAFNEVNTPYLVMCADDDFVIQDGIEDCLAFLQANSGYTAAGGNIICYKNSPGKGGEISFSGMYLNELNYEVIAEDAFTRLQEYFSRYKAIFYSVHQTIPLQKVFAAAASKIHNLFLNEYLTAVVPIAAGKYKDLPVLYQVREFSPVSGDKTTLNIDGIQADAAYKDEYQAFINSQAGVMAGVTGKETADCVLLLNKIFEQFGRDLPSIRNAVDTSFKKKAGMLIQKIPFIGDRLIQLSRKKERLQQVDMLVKTVRDKKNMLDIKDKIIQYS